MVSMLHAWWKLNLKSQGREKRLEQFVISCFTFVELMKE